MSKISRQIIFSESVGFQKKNNSISFDKKSLNMKLSKNNFTIEHSHDNKKNRIFHLLNHNEKFKISKLIKKNYDSKAKIIRKNILNKKIRCSSMEFNNNIPNKHLNSIYKKDISINLNKTKEKKSNRDNEIKRINNTLNSFISSINFKKNENNLLYILQSYSVYYSALDEYIKLLSSKEEINLLNIIKLGFGKIFYKLQKIKSIKDKFDENSFSFKSTNKETNSFKTLNKKIIPINKKIISKDNKKLIDKMNKTCLNSVKIKDDNNKNEILETDNINLTDLESIRFCDKISMREINPYHAIPKLDLSFFNCQNKQSNKKINNPSKKNKKIRNYSSYH